jgi:membrane protease YdiL (CAAX protease family)
MRDSWTLPGSIFLNNRGFFAPYPVFEPRVSWVVGAFVVGLVVGWLYEKSGSLLPPILCHYAFNLLA